jgi:opacity protein-like surface antigen
MTRLYKLGAVLVAAGMLSVQGYAAPETGTQELGVAGAFEFTDSLYLDVTYGYFVTPEWEVKGVVGVAWDDWGDDDYTSIMIGGAVDYHFTMLDVENMLPYVEVGVGYINSDLPVAVDSDDEDAFMARIGGGVKYFLAENTALNVGLFFEWASEDVFSDEDEAEDSQFVIPVGLNFYF